MTPEELKNRLYVYQDHAWDLADILSGPTQGFSIFDADVNLTPDPDPFTFTTAASDERIEQYTQTPRQKPPTTTSPLVGTGQFIKPAQGEVRSPFGMRTHPVYGNRRLHAGIDLRIPTGTTIYAMAAGVVTKAANTNPTGYGNEIRIQHGSGFESRYAHLSRMDVRVGQNVTQGQSIGLSGGAKGAPGAGNSTGPHLHYELRRNGTPVDPKQYTG